jgi:glycosyltransferase involved in cell wall biosynthesis
MLIKSFAQVVNRYPQIKLYIIGPVHKECDANENLRLIKDLNLSNSVILKGTVSFKEIPQILKNAKILALCRPDNLQAKHGFATKIGEYLLTENPVVLTAVGDFPLFFKDKENALLSEPDNPTAFAEKILWALDNPNEAAVVGKNGAKLSEKEFLYINVVKQICKIMNFLR